MDRERIRKRGKERERERERGREGKEVLLGLNETEEERDCLQNDNAFSNVDVSKNFIYFY